MDEENKSKKLSKAMKIIIFSASLLSAGVLALVISFLPGRKK